MLTRAGRRDHVRTSRLGDLHGEVADPTSGRVDQDTLPGLQLRAADTVVIRRTT
ncbi:hypothetical protein ACWDKQ_19540 [Saccharopolyspora sp. NPDC000995]